jgi:DNA-binding NtrC family response regulator
MLSYERWITALLTYRDDESDIRELLKDFLDDEGYRCHTAIKRLRAMTCFKQLKTFPDHVRHPYAGKSGLELLAEIKAQDEDVVVIMISRSRTLNRPSPHSNGAYDYVSKPSSSTKLP